MRNPGNFALATVLASWSLASATQAQVVEVTDRSVLELSSENDFVQWADLGSSGTIVSNPFAFASSGGIATGGPIDLTISTPSGMDFEVRYQGNGWTGNFAPGQALLTTGEGAGPIVIEFSTPVFAAGAQIQPSLIPAEGSTSFTGIIRAFDLENNMYTFQRTGDSTSAADNSAIFLGVMSTEPIIQRIEFDISGLGSSFAINGVDLIAVPEPHEYALLFALGLAGFGLWRRYAAAPSA